MKLTDRTVEAARCPDGRKDALIFDDTLKGFGLRVTAGGKRMFIVQYRVGATVRRTPLGQWGTELTTAQARRKAEALRGQVRDKRDPVAERKAAQVATLAADAQAKAAAARDAYTVDTLIDDWTVHHLCCPIRILPDAGAGRVAARSQGVAGRTGRDGRAHRCRPRPRCGEGQERPGGRQPAAG